MMTRWLWVLACALTLGQSRLGFAQQEKVQVGDLVKNFTLKVVNPDEVGLPYVGIDRYVGPDAKEAKKAVLLSFFASYCEPCKRELPFLSALYGLYREKGFVVLSISIDKEAEKIEEIKTLAKQAQATFPVLSDRFNIVAKRFTIEKLPCLYLIGGDGKVAMVNVGYNDNISKDLLDNIRKGIGEPVSDPVPDSLTKFMKGNDATASAVDIKPDPTVDPAATTATADASGDEGDSAEDPAGDQTKGKGKKALATAKKKDKGKAGKKGKKKGGK